MTCDWPVDRTCLPAIDDTDTDAQRLLGMATELAKDVLWALSGRQFGACPHTVRPCPTPCPTLSRRGVCGCGSACIAAGPTVIRLPGPADSILYVEIDGAPTDTTSYQLEGDLLYRTGGAAWPAQDLTRPLGEDGTWAVVYNKGISPPDHVARLVGLLAAEFYAACTGGKCKLPRRVQSVTRNGLSFQMADPTSVFREGLTGITEVDLWLNAVNPRGIATAPKVR